ncbi:rhamnogalacturonan acetylesterase, partial [Lentzea sp. BCCO 10_0798]|nr:rhamnogalacturonan acetylesterase [Lentzea sp. BCCO 10_0798]
MSLKRLALLTAAVNVAVLIPVPAVAAAAALPPQCSGTAPIKCSFNVAPGNYDVTVELGSTSKAANTSMSVEARRQILRPVSTTAGQLIRTA